MPRGAGWIWTAEKLEELIGVMKAEGDVSDPETGTVTFCGSMGLAKRLVRPYDKIDDTITLTMIVSGLQMLQELGMLEPGRPGTLPPGYERRFTARPITEEMIVHLKAWKAQR